METNPNAIRNRIESIKTEIEHHSRHLAMAVAESAEDHPEEVRHAIGADAVNRAENVVSLLGQYEAAFEEWKASVNAQNDRLKKAGLI